MQLQPKVSCTRSAVVAATISQRLGIDNMWSVFGKLWNMPAENLRKYHDKALNQPKTLAFQEELNKALR